VGNVLPSLVPATPRDPRPEGPHKIWSLAPKGKHGTTIHTNEMKPRRAQTLMESNPLSFSTGPSGCDEAGKQATWYHLVLSQPRGSWAATPRRSAPLAMLALQPLQVERADLAYSTETVPFSATTASGEDRSAFAFFALSSSDGPSSVRSLLLFWKKKWWIAQFHGTVHIFYRTKVMYSLSGKQLHIMMDR
jgi:hypothetical protein